MTGVRPGARLRFEKVCIESVGYVLPPHVVTSADLEDAVRATLQRLGIPPGQIEALSGVRERRWWDPGTQPSTVAAQAAERALEKAGIGAGDVQCLINTSVCRDWLEPATAAMVSGKLGLPHTSFSFDVANACIGFLNGILLAGNMIELGQIDTALVVDGESSREPVLATLERLRAETATADDFRDNFATLTLGSGAVAAVIRRADLCRTPHVVKGAALRSAFEHNQLCVGNHDAMRADPRGLLVHGVNLAIETLPHAAAELGWSLGDVDEYICHQVSLAHFKQLFQRVELPLEKAMLTFPFLGNVGPASMPLTLALGEDQGRVKPGSEICLLGVGSGLGSIIMGVTW